MSIFNYLLGFPFQPVNDKGAAHNDDSVNREDGTYIFMWENREEIVDHYLKAVDYDSERWNKNTADFPPRRIINIPHNIEALTYVSNRLNISEYDSLLVDIVSHYLRSGKLPLSKVVRTHLTKRQLLHDILKKANIQATVVQITIHSLEDIAMVQALADSKNEQDADEPTETISKHLTWTRNYSELHQRLLDMYAKEPEHGEFLLPFSYIRNKDEEGIMSLVKKVASHCGLLISNLQETEIRRYIDEYFSKQPVIPI